MITDLQTWVHGDHDISLIKDAMDHHTASAVKKKSLQKNQACMGVKPMTSVLK